MKRPLIPQDRTPPRMSSVPAGAAAIRHSQRAWLVATTLAGTLALGAGCTGQVEGGQSGSPGSGGAGAGAPGGTGGSTGSPAGSGGTPGGGAPGTGSGGTGIPTGTGGQGGDPYAIPANPPPPAYVATSRVARLSRQQWANAVRDLLKLPDITDIDKTVTGDALMGFDNEGDALFVTEQLRSQLFDASEKLADKVTGDAAALARLTPANAPTDAAGKAKAFITTFGQRAFRRPLTTAEVTTYTTLFNQGTTLYPGGDAYKAGVGLTIQAMLQAPYFLYRTELTTGATGATKVPLDDWEVAAKVALAITNTIPDDMLLAAAQAGQLRDKAAVMAQAVRLMQGPTGTAGVSNLNMQVYRLGTYDGITRDAAAFPDFKPNAPAAMRQEVLQYLDWMLTQGRGIKDFYSTPVGFVNSLLAPIYGVTGTFSSDPTMLTKVDLDPTKRSGLLTQAGFLSSYISVGNEPDIIHRGVFIATRLLCRTLPPPDEKAAGTQIPTTPNMTNRERVEMTTGKGTCGEVCHANLFNPLGYAFENYDAIGKYRTMDQGKPVVANDVYRLDGQLKSFSNGVELSMLLADAKETHSCYVQNMMSYMHGRDLVPAEVSGIVDYYGRLSRAGMLTLRDLALNVVTGETFLNRLP
jgi:hypothetical protein